MARYRWMRLRMENWSNWKVRQDEGGGGRYASMRYEAPTPKETDPFAAAPVHPNEEDAWEIDAALRAMTLSTDLRATIECHYLSRYTETEKLRRLNIAKSSLVDRLDRIDGLLVRYFGDRHQAGQHERARVEKLQRDRLA